MPADQPAETTAGWVARAEAFVAENPPPVGAPPGSRTPSTPPEHVAWAAWSRRFHASGLAMMRWPSERGGSSATAEQALAVTEVMAAAAMPLSLSDIGINLVGPALIASGTPAQQQQHLPGILDGSAVWTQLFSEPEAGSDLAAIRATARPDGDHWVIDGQKVWSTYAHIADWGFLLARSGTREERHRGITAFLVPMDVPGVTVRPLREITGHHDFNEVFFDGARLGPEHVLGEPGQGWRVAMELLVDERAVTGRNIIGLMAELDRLSTLISPSADPVSADRLGELCADAMAIRALGDAADLTDGADTIAKIAFSDLNVDVHQFAVDLVNDLRHDVVPGWAHRWQDGYMYSRGYTISGGANEILRNVIAKRVIGLPSR